MIKMNASKNDSVFGLKFLLFYYRSIGVTFGGLTLINNELITKSYLNKLGYFTSVLIIIANGLITYGFYINATIYAIYKSGFEVMYYLILGQVTLISIEVSINVLHLQRNGVHLFKVMTDYMIKGTNKIANYL